MEAQAWEHRGKYVSTVPDGFPRAGNMADACDVRSIRYEMAGMVDG
jgi:hypothetical protein